MTVLNTLNSYTFGQKKLAGFQLKTYITIVQITIFHSGKDYIR